MIPSAGMDGCSALRRSGGLIYLLFVLFLIAGVFAGAATGTSDRGALLKTATRFHLQCEYGRSIPVLKELVRLYPGDYEGNLLLGEDLLRNGNVEDSLTPLRAAAEIRFKEGTALPLLADAAVSLGDFSSAAQALQAAVVREPDSEVFLVKWADFSLDRSRDLGIALRRTKAGEAVMLRVNAASRAERAEVREGLLAESAAKSPEQPGIWGELGALQIALGKSSEAAESLKKARQREPRSTATLQLEALTAAFEQRWADAAARLSAIAARSPADLKSTLESWPRYLLPEGNVRGKVWDCLRNHDSKCVLAGTEPRNKNAWSAQTLYEEGRWEELVALPMSRDPEPTEWLRRGVAFARTEDCSRAIPALERGFESDELTSGYWLELCYAKAGQTVMGSLAKMGKQVALHELKGDLLLRLRNDATAAQWEYAEALKLRPNDPHLLARLADALNQIGDTTQAGEAARSAVAGDPHETEALRLLARMAMSERNYEEAIVRLRALVVCGSPDDWTQVQLGVAYGQSGQAEEAVRYLEPELRAGYPDQKGALHALMARALRKVGRDQDAESASKEAARLAAAAMETDGGGNADVHP